MADTGIFAWLDRASRCGDVDVERSAEMLKNYYQGIGPEPEYQEFDQSNDRQMIVKQDADGWPGEIYLQAGDDPLSHFSEYDEVSWCDHPQGESDVRYVRADESLVALASRPAEVDDWIKLSEQEPEVGETVLVFSEIWGSSRVLRFRVQPWKSFLDADQGRWFWNLETMLWKRFSAPSHTTNKEK